MKNYPGKTYFAAAEQAAQDVSTWTQTERTALQEIAEVIQHPDERLATMKKPHGSGTIFTANGVSFLFHEASRGVNIGLTKKEESSMTKSQVESALSNLKGATVDEETLLDALLVEQGISEYMEIGRRENWTKDGRETTVHEIDVYTDEGYHQFSIVVGADGVII